MKIIAKKTRSWKKSCVCAAIAAGAAAYLVKPVSAQDYWLQPAGGSWDNPANWSLGTVPGTAIFNLPSGSPYTVTMAGTDEYGGALSVQNNDVTFAPTAQVFLVATMVNINASAGQSSSFTFNGAQNGSSQSQLYVIGENPFNGSGYVTVGGGGGATSLTVNNALISAESSGDVGGAGFRFESGSTVMVSNSTFGGDQSTGMLVAGTATFNNTNLTIASLEVAGNGPNGGILNVTNGSYFSSQRLTGVAIGSVIGEPAETGTINVYGGSGLGLALELIDVGVGFGSVGTLNAINGGGVGAQNIDVGGNGIGTVNMSSGTMDAYITLSLGNNGTLIVGGGPRQLNFEGSLNMSSGSILDVIQANSSSSPLYIFKEASLAGTFNLILADGFEPSLGETFQPLTLANQYGAIISGTFSTINLPPLNPGLGWNTQMLYTNGTISVIAVPEPATAAELAICAGAVLACRRTSRRYRSLVNIWRQL